MLKECNGDLDQLLDRLKAAEVQDRRLVVTTTFFDPEKSKAGLSGDANEQEKTDETRSRRKLRCGS